jgi:hypothetical protein
MKLGTTCHKPSVLMVIQVKISDELFVAQISSGFINSTKHLLKDSNLTISESQRAQ